MSRRLLVKSSGHGSQYDIVVSEGSLAACGAWARGCLGNEFSKIVIVSNPTVFKLYGRRALASFNAAGFDVSHFLMRDGERYKSLSSTAAALRAFARANLSRTDAVIALGGGVVGDLAGFAAAVYLRGIRFLQIPTTLLAMIDSSVGGKTGVNTDFGKNLVGAFHQPSGVLIDPSALATLPARELRAGVCEMVKHAALSGRRLLKDTDNLLSSPVSSGYGAEPDGLSDLIFKNVKFKASIVGGDEFESVSRRDARSRKILNLGHTLAHALEKVTRYEYFKHGEAVGHGILFAAELSKSLALCDKDDVKLLNDVMRRVGPLPPLAGIDEREVLEAFIFDKKHVAGSLQMVLLKGIGRPVIVDARDIPHSSTRKVLKGLLRKWA